MKNKTIQIAEYFGMNHQQSKAIEEYAEVIHVIARIQTEGVSVELRERLIEELADAEVMKDQLMFFHEITEDDINKIKEEKIERTIRRSGLSVKHCEDCTSSVTVGWTVKCDTGTGLMEVHDICEDFILRKMQDKTFKVDTKSKDRIINLVGASGTGKTTLAKELEKEGFNIIHSYTTRKPRYENEWGHTFANLKNNAFLKESPERFKKEMIGSGFIIAFKEVYPGLYYWATKEQYQGKGTSIYIVDPDGAEQIRENVKDAEVVTIYLNVDTAMRAARLIGRGFNPDSYEFKEGENKNTYYDAVEENVVNRIFKDIDIFKVVKSDYTVDANRELEEVLEDVIRIIDND